ncbi:MAG: hypothetical protein ACLQMT_01975 [Candidatus Acidiferrales bacterium]
MTYKVMIDDNFHYMDEEERITHGEFETLEAAIEACKKIVNDCLAHAYTPGASAEKLYAYYTMFGEDPWVLGGEGVPFSAWTYAKERCAEICAGAR